MSSARAAATSRSGRYEYFLFVAAMFVLLTLRASLLQTVDGTRGRQVLHVPHIPLTPGPLVVVIKVASSQVANTSGY